jgi:hypothetical protein
VLSVEASKERASRSNLIGKGSGFSLDGSATSFNEYILLLNVFFFIAKKD